MHNKEKCAIILSEQEQRLIKILREIGYGQAIIYLEAGNPVRIEQIKKSIKINAC